MGGMKFLNKSIIPHLNNKHPFLVGAKIMELRQNVDAWGIEGVF